MRVLGTSCHSLESWSHAPNAHSQMLQALLIALIQIGTGDFPEATLLIPTLRTEDVFLQNLVSLCYSWVDKNCKPLVCLSIMAGFAAACNSADLPAARSTCMMIRSRPSFRNLLKASLIQVPMLPISAWPPLPPPHLETTHTLAHTMRLLE